MVADSPQQRRKRRVFWVCISGLCLVNAVLLLKFSGALPRRVGDIALKITYTALAGSILYTAYSVAKMDMRVGYEGASCASCGYDIAGAASARCPECGADLGAPRAIVRGRRLRWLPIALGALLAAIAVAVSLFTLRSLF